MAFRTLSELVHSLRLRSDGIAGNLPDLVVVGLSQGDVDQCREFAEKLASLNAEREALKSAMLVKTEELGKLSRTARRFRKKMTLRIKAALLDNPERWVAFGINAKQ